MLVLTKITTYEKTGVILSFLRVCDGDSKPTLERRWTMAISGRGCTLNIAGEPDRVRPVLASRESRRFPAHCESVVKSEMAYLLNEPWLLGLVLSERAAIPEAAVLPGQQVQSWRLGVA
jgi:hypothetical protein